MGASQVTSQNLKVVGTDTENGLIMIKGAVPGSKGTWVKVQDAVKKTLPEEAPFPAGLRDSGLPSEDNKTKNVPDAVQSSDADNIPAEKATSADSQEPGKG